MAVPDTGIDVDSPGEGLGTNREAKPTGSTNPQYYLMQDGQVASLLIDMKLCHWRPDVVSSYRH